MADESPGTNSRPRRVRASGHLRHLQACAKREVRKKLKEVSDILKKKETDRSEEEAQVLTERPDLVETAKKNAERQLQQKKRVLEIQDPSDELDEKCKELAQLIQTSRNAVVYTGAGISTAASIPDYRGPNGVWTLLKKGQALRPQDLADAEPTFTHMCLTKLYKEGLIKYIVSQNCDGLHLRSGFPRHSLSEVHGNMFIEICKNCKPQKEFIRLFDVTERTAKGRHKTGRTCSKCGESLQDSIVHFGEKGGLKSPYRWREASKAASKSDLIICLGSSLKVLRCYPCLWRMDKRPHQRPKLVIVNLQWTPKDETSRLKINGNCDDVMRKVAHYLGLAVPHYRRAVDPLFRLQTPVKKNEETVRSKKILEPAECTLTQKARRKRKCLPPASNTARLQLSGRTSVFKNYEKTLSPFTDSTCNIILPDFPLKEEASDLFHAPEKQKAFKIKDENVTMTEQRFKTLRNRKTLKLPVHVRAKLERLLHERQVQEDQDKCVSFEEDACKERASTKECFSNPEQICSNIQVANCISSQAYKGYASTHPVLSLQLNRKSYAREQVQLMSCLERKTSVNTYHSEELFSSSFLPSFEIQRNSISRHVNELPLRNIKQEDISKTSFKKCCSDKPPCCASVMSASTVRQNTLECSSNPATLSSNYAKGVKNIANDHTYAKSLPSYPFPFGFHTAESNRMPVSKTLNVEPTFELTQPGSHQTGMTGREISSYSNLLVTLLYQTCKPNEPPVGTNIKDPSCDRLLQNDGKHVTVPNVNYITSSSVTVPNVNCIMPSSVSSQCHPEAGMLCTQPLIQELRTTPLASFSRIESMQQMESLISITFSNNPPPPVVRVDLNDPAKCSMFLGNILDKAGILEGGEDVHLPFEHHQELTVARLNECTARIQFNDVNASCRSEQRSDALGFSQQDESIRKVCVGGCVLEKSLGDVTNVAQIKPEMDIIEAQESTSVPDSSQEVSAACVSILKAQKRRCSTAVSVPGWYGKGLKVRRKRTL